MEKDLTGREFKNIVYNELAKIGKALSDPKRLELIDLLCQSEKNVEQLAKEMNLSIASTSHHLKTLKESKLAKSRKEGRFVYYSATTAAIEIWKSLSNTGEEHLSEIKYAIASFFNSEEAFQMINFQDLHSKVKKGEVLLLDVRPEGEYHAGHFPGSISVPMKELEEKINSLPKNKNVVAYCRGPYCVLSHNTVNILRKRGITAYRLIEGTMDWVLQGNQLEYGTPEVTSSNRKKGR